MRRFNTIKLYFSVYRNWLGVLFNTIIGTQNIKLVFRNGFVSRYPRDLRYVIANIVKSKIFKPSEINFDGPSGVLTLRYKERTIRLKVLRDGIINADLSSFFGDYAFLEPLENKQILDIGANIGDSAIWFSIQGAMKVVAIEPYRFTYEIAEANIKENGLENRIILINAGYGEDGFIELDDKQSTIGSKMIEYTGGLRTRLMSLKSLLEYCKQEDNSEILLKMDCEGCEYGIMKEPKEILRKFAKILIEYHDGYESLEEKLIQSGFKVTVSQPISYVDKTEKEYVQGYLRAERN